MARIVARKDRIDGSAPPTTPAGNDSGPPRSRDDDSARPLRRTADPRIVAAAARAGRSAPHRQGPRHFGGPRPGGARPRRRAQRAGGAGGARGSPPILSGGRRDGPPASRVG